MSYLLDTSAWVEFFRKTQSLVDREVTRLIRADPTQIRVCPPVRLELSLELDDLRRRRLLRTIDSLPDTGITTEDFEVAGQIHRATRAGGNTPRSLIDCLIAGIALAHELTLVHRDVDFDRMAEVVPELSVLRLAGS